MTQSTIEVLEAHKEQRHELKEKQKDESILTENQRRFVLFPIKFHEIYDAYKKRESLFWTAEEIEFAKDFASWNDGTSFKDDEKEYLTRLLAIFISNDLEKMNLTENLSAACQTPEAKCFYGFEIMVDNIHQEVYAFVVDSVVKDEKKRVTMFEEVEDSEITKKKIDYAKFWFGNEDDLFAEKLIAYAAIQCIFSLAAYTSILSTKSKNILPGFNIAVDNMFRDRVLHADFSALMYSHLKNKVDYEIFKKIIDDAVRIEKESLKEYLPIEKFNGLKISEMSQYIEYVADCLFESFGEKKFYNVSNPYTFMEAAPVPNRLKTFETTEAPAITNKADAEATTFNFNEDF